MRPEPATEDWLRKVRDGDVLVDLIFRPAGGPVEDGHFQRADELEVHAQRMLVASIDDILATKLLALTEQEPDFKPLLEVARALREQIDWEAVGRRTESSPFARAFLTLVEGLGIVGRPARLAAVQDR
ncbi:MAG TPA: hypothetical protein VNJ46_07800 [Gaiellaceae bacterium]|nr:hypothetical protein [Gaiellaceae bacterium]